MKKITLLLGLFVALITFGQTKLIAHKSHSGSNSTFSKALKSALFDKGDSNFGMAPNPNIKYAVLDSVIIVSDSQAVMVTSNYCKGPRYSERDVNTREYKEVEWGPGSDTVVNHPLFKKEHRIDSVREVLGYNYWFKSEGATVFVGFDEQKGDTIASNKTIINEESNSENEENETIIIGTNSGPNQKLISQILLVSALLLAAFTTSIVYLKRAKSTFS